MDPVIIREGAALRTSDEQSLLFIEDAISLGAELSPWGMTVYRTVRDALSDRRHIVVEDRDDEALLFDMLRLEEQLEADLATLENRDENTSAIRSVGYTVEREDGYVITPIAPGEDD